MKRCFLLVLFVLFVLTAHTGHAEEGFYYYNPYGGRYYHIRPDCASIKEEWQAKMEPFPPERLSEEPYSSLERCQPCFDPPMETVVPYVPYASPYDTADPNTRLDTEGCYRAGESLTPGLYCVTPGSGCDGMLEITAPSAVFRYELSDMTGCSFYLGENMSVFLPENAVLTCLEPKPLFQSMDAVAVDHERYFTFWQLPCFSYRVWSQEGKQAYYILSGIDAETGLKPPVRVDLKEGQVKLLELENSANTFVELVNCVVQPSESREG